MIFTLLIASIFAAQQQQALVCNQIFDPNFCKGPAAGAPGRTCVWDKQEYGCKEVKMNEAKDVCKTFSNNQAACRAQAQCFFDLSDFECKGKGNEIEFDHGHPATAQPGAYPNSIPSNTKPNAYPAATENGYNPQPATNQGALPGAGYNSATHATNSNVPAAGYNAGAHATTNNGNAHGAGYNTAATAGTGFNTIPTQPAGVHNSPVAQNPGVNTGANTGMPMYCKTLPQAQCFGPSVNHGKMCYWDAEDLECSEAFPNNIEAICKQFAGDAVKCDAHENCFWDGKDMECSEISEFRPFKVTPVVTTQCSNLHNVNECASEASCFWDKTVCINVIQASNVCSVLASAQACSTNTLCHWRENACKLAHPPASAGGFRLQRPRQQSTGYTNDTSDYVVMFACGFSGALLGLLCALASTRFCNRKTAGQDDDYYRDTVLDVSSQRRQVV